MTEHELRYMRALCHADEILQQYLGPLTLARLEIAKLMRECEECAQRRERG